MRSCCTFLLCICLYFFFFKQKTAYEVRISDWSSDVCSSDLIASWKRSPAMGERHDPGLHRIVHSRNGGNPPVGGDDLDEITSCDAPGGKKIGRASCRERVCQYV